MVSTPRGSCPGIARIPDFGQLTPQRTDMIITPSQMLDAPPPRITDFRRWNRGETDVIMTEIRISGL